MKSRRRYKSPFFGFPGHLFPGHLLLVVFFALACGSVFFVVACGSATFVVQQYDGEPRDADSISLLRLNGGTKVVVVSLDGEELSYVHEDPSTRVHIEMLPGKHELDIGNLDDPLHRVVTLGFVAEAGKVYRVTIDALEAGSLMRPWNALIWEVDRDSDRALHTVPPPSVLPNVPTTPPVPSSPATPSAPPSSAVPPAPSATPSSTAPPAPSATPSSTAPPAPSGSDAAPSATPRADAAPSAPTPSSSASAP